MSSFTQIIAEAKLYCEKHRYRFTNPRKRVLEVLLQQDKAIGAYGILALLTTDNYKPNPPTIYRAVEFWVEHSFIHKIMSLNHYVACTHFHKDKQVSFLVCDTCGMVREVHLEKSLNNFDNLENFSTHSVLTELHGKCADC